MIRTLLCVLLLVVASISLVLAQETPAPQSPVAGIVLKQDNRTKLLFIPSRIDGKACYLLLDTGATHTTLDKTYCQEELADHPLQDVTLLGQTNVHVKPQLITLNELVVGGRKMSQSMAMVVDLGPLRQALSLPIAGILGMNHLGEQAFALSVSQLNFRWLTDTTSSVPPSFKEVGADLTGNKIRLVGTTEKGAVSMIVDSAASHTFVPTGQWPEGQGGASYQVTTVNGQQDKPKFKQGEALDLRLSEGVELPQVTPYLFSDKKEALLGVDLLRSIDIIVDVPAQRLYANTRDHE